MANLEKAITLLKGYHEQLEGEEELNFHKTVMRELKMEANRLRATEEPVVSELTMEKTLAFLKRTRELLEVEPTEEELKVYEAQMADIKGEADKLRAAVDPRMMKLIDEIDEEKEKLLVAETAFKDRVEAEDPARRSRIRSWSWASPRTTHGPNAQKQSVFVSRKAVTH